MSHGTKGSRCSVAICKQTSERAKLAGETVLFFTFPKDVTIRKEWLSACHRQNNVNPNTARVCSVHFEEADYEDATRARLMGYHPKKLLKTAVPSLHLRPPSEHDKLSKPPEKCLLEKQRRDILSVLGFEWRDEGNTQSPSSNQDPTHLFRNNEAMEVVELAIQKNHGNRCSVAVCHQLSANAKFDNKTIVFHTFPMDAKIRKQWIIKCRRQDKVNPNTARVCSLHFKPEDYEDCMKARLMGFQPSKLHKHAVPSLHLLQSPRKCSKRSGKYILLRERKNVLADLIEKSAKEPVPGSSSSSKGISSDTEQDVQEDGEESSSTEHNLELDRVEESHLVRNDAAMEAGVLRGSTSRQVTEDQEASEDRIKKLELVLLMMRKEILQLKENLEIKDYIISYLNDKVTELEHKIKTSSNDERVKWVNAKISEPDETKKFPQGLSRLFT